MIDLNLIDFGTAFILGIFIFGALSFVIGVFVLVRRTFGKEIRTIARQTSLLVKKGLAEDVAGLVGNASALLNATNELIRTAAGIGVFLTLLGVVLMVAASLLIFNFH